MPKDGSFYDLGKKPKKLNDIGNPMKINYPTLNLDVDQYPPLKDMKLGGTAQACIEFKISKYGGLDVVKIRPLKYEKEGGK